MAEFGARQWADHCEKQAARIAALEAQVAALAAVLADILAQGVSLNDERLRYVEVQIPRDVLSDVREVLSADATHLAQLDAARREVCRVACAYLDSPVPSLWIGDLSQAVLALHEVENRQPAERGEGE